MKHLSEMNNNALAKQSLLLSEELRSKKQVCFLTNIDKILKSYDINSSIDDFQSLSFPSIKQYVTKTETSYVNLWQASKQNTRKLVFYNTFKKEFKPEGYLDQIKHICARKQFAKFRISNHQLQVETGHYRTDKTFNTNRICQLCNLNDTEDENHLLFYCHYYNSIRISFTQNLNTLYPDFVYKKSEECIEQLMNSSNNVTVKLFSKFVYDCFLKRSKFII